MGTAKYTIEDWRAVRRALDAGGTIRGVAEQTGVNRLLNKGRRFVHA